MAFPIIYCDKKQATVGEEITLYRGSWSSSPSAESVWSFPNSVEDVDYEIVNGAVTDDSITIKVLVDTESFVVDQIITTNEVVNGSAWTDTSVSGVGDFWSAPTVSQTNQILSGWNFNGNSQRVTQDVGTAYIFQSNLVENIDEYNISLKYRASDPLRIKVGGETFNLPATESSEFEIYPIQHTAGLVEFTGVDGGGNQWILSDGTFSTATSISKILPAGTSYLIMNEFNGSAITSVTTGSIYTGALMDFPNNIAVVELEDTNATGDIWELNHVQETVYISNTGGIYGEVQALSGLTDTIDLSGCSNISGDISSLTNAETIVLYGCAVSGALPEASTFTHLNLSNTDLTFDNVVDTIVNTSNRADAQNLNNGYFECCENMPTISGTPACDAYFNLISRGWTVLVPAYCGGSWSGC